MKTISIFQPWASLVVHGFKNSISLNRHTHKPIDELGIHSMNHEAPIARRLCELPQFVAALGAMGYADISEMPKGQVLGYVLFTGQGERDAMSQEQNDEYMLFGDVEPGRWIWNVKEPMLLMKPFKFAGRPATFDVPDNLVRQAEPVLPKTFIPWEGDE